MRFGTRAIISQLVLRSLTILLQVRKEHAQLVEFMDIMDHIDFKGHVGCISVKVPPFRVEITEMGKAVLCLPSCREQTV